LQPRRRPPGHATRPASTFRVEAELVADEFFDSGLDIINSTIVLLPGSKEQIIPDARGGR
jgi:hypothetical protein